LACSIDKVNNVFTRARCARVVTYNLFSSVIKPTDWIELFRARGTIYCHSWITKDSILGIALTFLRSCESRVLCLASLAVAFSCGFHDLRVVVPYPTEHIKRHKQTGEGDFVFLADIHFPSRTHTRD